KSGSSGPNVATALVMGGMFVTFVMIEVILLAGAAFTVTARQQQRMLATVSSVGAPRALLFNVVAATGIVLGAVGAIGGIILGVAGAFLFLALTDNGDATAYYGRHIPGLWLAGIFGFAVLTGWLAALIPARRSSRFDI